MDSASPPSAAGRRLVDDGARRHPPPQWLQLLGTDLFGTVGGFFQDRIITIPVDSFLQFQTVQLQNVTIWTKSG